MLTTPVLVLALVLAALLVGLALIYRSRAAVPRAAHGSSSDTSWMAATNTVGGGSDCAAGSAGCDGGGGGA